MDARFEAVVGPHFAALHRAALRLTRRRSDAEDLVQEVCLRAFAEIDRLASLDYPLGWLLRVQYRVFVDTVRRRKRSPLKLVDDGEDAPAEPVSDAPGPDEAADAGLTAERLSAAWLELNREQRALLAMHAEGYDLGELERITGISRNALSARLHRARTRLAKLLESENGNRVHWLQAEN
jgi:RNA polymerase sigma factor (sigma-70 family)